MNNTIITHWKIFKLKLVSFINFFVQLKVAVLPHFFLFYPFLIYLLKINKEKHAIHNSVKVNIFDENRKKTQKKSYDDQRTCA